MSWYFAENGQKDGPHEEDAFQELVRSGRVGAKTLVWRTGMENWQPLEQVQPRPDTSAAATAPPAGAPVAKADSVTAPASAQVARCGLCGAEHSREDLLRFRATLICASCKPGFLQRMREGTSQPGKLRYAGFWIRFAAKFIDGIILTVFSVAISLLSMGTMAGLVAEGGDKPPIGKILALQGLIMLLQLSAQAAFITFFLSRYAATPGKMATGLVVIRSDGSALNAKRAFGRFAGELLSGITLGIGYIMAAFDEEKRALHDRVCDTRVAYKASVAA